MFVWFCFASGHLLGLDLQERNHTGIVEQPRARPSPPILSQRRHEAGTQGVLGRHHRSADEASDQHLHICWYNY